MAGKNIVELTKNNFDEEVKNSQIPVLVDFWASWCGPCRMVLPIMDELADEYAGKAKICKVNVDEQGELALDYGVMTIPTIILFKNGELAEQLTGAYPKSKFDEMLKKVIK